MANRYLRASGNWNGPVWAATPDGVAGSISTAQTITDKWLYTGAVYRGTDWHIIAATMES